MVNTPRTENPVEGKWEDEMETPSCLWVLHIANPV